VTVDLGASSGLFEYKRMPFSLRNAGPSSQQHMDRTIRDCHAAFAWVSDIVVCSRNHEEHVVHAQQVQQALQDKSRDIRQGGGGGGLGHKISAPGVLSVPSHVSAIQELPHPTNIKELQAFLGIVNFYRRFLPSIAGMLRPLTDELRSSKKGPDKLFACYSGIRHLRYMLDGHRFAIFPDHMPLSYALARVSDPWTACHSRQLSYVARRVHIGHSPWKGQPMLWWTLSPSHTDTWQQGGLTQQ
jgi:hypothetical protein